MPQLSADRPAHFPRGPWCRNQWSVARGGEAPPAPIQIAAPQTESDPHGRAAKSTGRAGHINRTRRHKGSLLGKNSPSYRFLITLRTAVVTANWNFRGSSRQRLDRSDACRAIPRKGRPGATHLQIQTTEELVPKTNRFACTFSRGTGQTLCCLPLSLPCPPPRSSHS